MTDYKTIPIVRIEPAENTFIVAWHLHDRCNFDCMYCPDKWHSLTSTPKSLSDLKRCWIEIYQKTIHRNLKYKISLTGGEVTINQDLLPFITWLTENYKDDIALIGFVTNGSANDDLYTELMNYVDWISFSTHSEFFNEKKFFDTVVKVKDYIHNTNKSVHVNIMDEPWHQERIKVYKKFLSSKDINFSISEIDFSLKIRDQARANPNKNYYNFDE